MNNRQIIYESLKIIEDNLKSEISVQEISDKLGFSVYYFIRLFKGVTGFSPKAYLLKRKITEAAIELMNGNKKIIDTAFDFGFGSPETFSRAFQKQFGFNPGQLKTGEMITSENFLRPLTAEKLEYVRSLPEKDPELIDFGPLHLIGMPLYFNQDMPEDLSVPWKAFANNTESIIDRVKPEKYYQVQYWFPNQDYGSIFFFLAIEVEAFKNIPIQFTAKTLPAQKYLRFYHRGFSNKVGLTYEYIYNTYLPETEYKLPHLFNFEYYPPDHKGPYNEDSLSEIYIPVTLK
ncbi:MAG: AraC family transcriptional regulator [Spirochaetales bacterium]|nr:AraC family transcriptional regulator [Spirochaetales bacterium]